MARMIGRWACAGLLAWAAVGCGGGDQRQTANLSGRVTFKGQPVPTGYITFMPEVSGGNRGEVKSFPIKDGSYNTADGPNPGVYPGANVVRISGFDGKPAKFFPDGKQIFNPIELKETVAGGTKDFEVPPSAGVNVRIEPTSDIEN
jgi:hypothetical protein